MKTKTPLYRIAALFALALLATFAAPQANAQFTLTGSNYTQNFNSLGTDTINNITGRNLNNVSTNLNGWYFLETGSGANSNITVGTGTSNAGDTYNFGVAGNSDRSLGGLQSGTVVPSWGFWFSNSVGATITNLQITYLGETWRIGSSNRSDRLDFSSSSNATTLSNGTWTTNASLGYTNVGAATASGSLLQSATISNNLAVSIAAGSTFFIRWTSFDATGADDGMSIDDFNMTALYSSIIAGNYWAQGATGGGTGTWSSANNNWATAAGTQGTGPQASTGTLIFAGTAGTVSVSGAVSAVAGLTFSNTGYTVTGGTSITLTGADAAANTITTDASVGATINSVLAGAAGMTKAGTGTLTLSGNNTFTGALNVHDGTLEIASINNNSANGTLGNSTNPVSLGKSGTANVSTLRYTGGTASTTKGFTMASDATAGVINVANSGTTLTVSGPITGSSGSGLTKTGIGRLSLSGSSSYNGATTVSAGDLNLSGGSIASSAVTVASGASLSGYGSVGTIGGAGAINPGNSPGILTTPQVNPLAGTTFNFEMTGTAPIYSNAASSVNDVIRITGAPSFSASLAAGNGINIYFSGAALFTGSTAVQYQGGFFTDQSASFASSISGATYNYYFANGAGSTTYNGASYYSKAQYESLVLGTNMLITVSTVAQTANFGGGNISGQVMQVQVIPEPSTYALLGLSAVAFGAYRWRRRHRG
jgi:autotransporter-associated beta strand protein